MQTDLVLDLMLIDEGNPRSVAFQIARIAGHFGELPRLTKEGVVDPIDRALRLLLTEIETSEAGDIDDAMILGIENRLLALSAQITDRYFDQRETQVEVAEGLG